MPKAGNITRLIFNLSFEFPEGSVNSCTPKELCSVKYNDLEHVIRNCLFLRQETELAGYDVIFMGKTDLSSAFRVLSLKVKCFKWLILKAVDPCDGKTKFFIEKCLLFGSSISCSHYQLFSNAL